MRGRGILARVVVGTAAMGFIALPACSDDSSDTSSPAAGGGTVNVTLQEFAVGTDVTSIGAGSVTFDATNNGPNDDHEFVVIKTDLPATDLPTDTNGAVDEEGEGIEVLDEIEEFPPGESKSLTVDLDAGAYVLICNIYDKAEQESHYQEGMRTPFTVT